MINEVMADEPKLASKLTVVIVASLTPLEYDDTVLN